MDLLVTVIGNAVADPAFREVLVENPRKAIDDWGFRLSKGEMRIVDSMFAAEDKPTVLKAFDNLQDLLFQAMRKTPPFCPQKACLAFGCYPPASEKELRVHLDKLKELDELKNLVELKTAELEAAAARAH